MPVVADREMQDAPESPLKRMKLTSPPTTSTTATGGGFEYEDVVTRQQKFLTPIGEPFENQTTTTTTSEPQPNLMAGTVIDNIDYRS